MFSPLRNETLDLHKKLLAATFVKPGQTIIDAGAHLGKYSKYYASLVGNKGRIFAFEAHPVIYKETSKILDSLPQIELIHAALSNQSDQIVSLLVNPDEDFAECATVEQSMANAHSDFFTNQTQVEVKTKCVDDLGLEECSLFKIDVEGHEHAVIEGATKCLKQCKPLVIMEYRSMDGEEVSTVRQLQKLDYVVYDGRSLQQVQPGYQSELTDLFGIPFSEVEKFESGYASSLRRSMDPFWHFVSRTAYALGRT